MGSHALVDKIEIQVVVDNTTDSLSSIPAHAESEFTYLERQGMRELSGDSLCCACHGLSLLITATRPRAFCSCGRRCVIVRVK